ncbi:hypothetical protein ANN_08627 [Periplaneta americana]|uniref:C2H2-type domain-containing protein n=1 Tax=Periplaneta americana TaxID=6978 RepID=A0ABQ8T1Z0_PERAM|nr:hypothetical protein ANN_08627 [Periplaneta americana]
MCKLCNQCLDWRKKDVLDKHIKSGGHVKTKETVSNKSEKKLLRTKQQAKRRKKCFCESYSEDVSADEYPYPQSGPSSFSEVFVYARESYELNKFAPQHELVFRVKEERVNDEAISAFLLCLGPI